MTTDNRKIQLGAEVDATGARKGFQEIKDAGKEMARDVQTSAQVTAKAVDGIGDGAGTSAQKVDGATRSLIGSIQRTTAAMSAGSKSSAEYFRSLAEQRGANLDVLQPYLAQLDAAIIKTRAAKAEALDLSRVGTSLGASGYQRPLGNPTTSLGATPWGAIAAESQKAKVVATQSLDSIGMSAKATQAALRGVPAQFTDIAVSLQGGQNPLTVLLQQGGQLKDMFGGIGPAARALGGYIASLITPTTLAAAAVATLAYAWYSADERGRQFQKTLIVTGDYAGRNAQQLDDLARGVSSTIGTYGQAQDALTALVGSGRLAGDSLSTVARAVVAETRSMGTAVEDAVATYIKLGEEPAKASAKLNESLHYLNLETYERIRVLEEQGRKEEAAALAQSTYAEATIQRMKQVQEQSGYLAQSFTWVADKAAGMWNTIAGGVASVGKQQSAMDRLVEAQRGLAWLEQDRGGGPENRKADFRAQIAAASRDLMREQDNAWANGERAREEQAKIAASDRLAEQKKATRSRADQRKAEIDQLSRDAKLVGMAADEYEKRVAAINEKYKDPKGPKAREYRDDAATKMLADLREQEASLKAQLDSSEKLTAAEKERAKFLQQIADLTGKDKLTAEQKSLLASKDAIKAQLDQNVALERQVVIKRELEKLDEKRKKAAEEFARQIEGINISIESANESRRDGFTRGLDAYGRGSRAQQELAAERAIRREYERYERQTTKDAADKDLLGSDAYKQQVEKIKASLQLALQEQQAYFDAVREKQSDWSYGATAGLQDYADQSANVAGQMADAFMNAFQGMEDALVQFVTTGKLDFKSLAESIIADISRIIIKAQITGPLSQMLMGGMSSGDGFGGFLRSGLNSLFGGGMSFGGGFGTGSAFGNQDLGMFFAKGGVVNSPGLSAYSGKVVDRPTVFPFAKGVGLMGEAGPEAILPLKRSPDGRLGVDAGNGGRPMSISITNQFAPGTDRATIGQGAADMMRTLQYWGGRNG